MDSIYINVLQIVRQSLCQILSIFVNTRQNYYHNDIYFYDSQCVVQRFLASEQSDQYYLMWLWFEVRRMYVNSLYKMIFVIPKIKSFFAANLTC